jgi:hypothetical protein
MSEHNIPNGLMHEAYQLYEGGHTTDDIKARFVARGMDGAMVDEVVDTVRAIRLKKRRGRGLTLTIVGSLVLVSAFLITYMLHHFNVNTDIPLYGLTTLGFTLLFIGMIYFMG